MTRRTRFRMYVAGLMLVLALGLTVLVLDPAWRRQEGEVIAQDPPPIAGPGWLHDSPQQITPDQARLLLQGRSGMTPQQVTASETAATAEIEALARALQNDPKLIFDYVHNMIDYVPTYGSINGATATLYAGRGNDCDQASLLIALLRTAGYQAQYVTGDVTYTTARLANWLDAGEDVAHNVLINGGVPVQAVSGGIQVSRVWVEARIGGTWYPLDPAMKEYDETDGLSGLGGIVGYDQSTFMGRAQQGATVTADSALNMNESNIRADLATYSGNLVEYLAANMPAAGVDEVIGGRRIVPAELSAYPTALPFAQGVANQSARMAQPPEAMRHTLSITRGDLPGDDHTFYSYEIAARRVTVFYDAGAAAAVLRVDGTPVVTYTATPTGTQFAITVTIDHPLAIPDQEGSFGLTSGAGSYALVHDWNGASSQLIGRRNQLLSEAVFDGQATDGEAVLGESLNIAGQVWMQQVALYNGMVDRMNETRTLSQHRVGIMGQEKGFYIDIPLSYAAVASTDGSSDTWLSGRVQSMMASAFEHGVLQQLQDHSGFDSVSTIRMLQFSNGQATKTFLADSSNWDTGSNVRGQLVDYDAADLAGFDALIADGFELLLPQDGRQAVGSWEGVGYIQRRQTAGSASMGMIINGGYAGGYTSEPVSLDGTQRYYADLGLDPWTTYRPSSRDPVDMYSGAFLYAQDDLALGPDEAPLGLRFGRSYNSHSAYTLGPLGYGWTHAYQWSARVHSSGPAGLGAGGAAHAASMIAYTHVALDLLADQLNVEGWTSTAIATKWAMDQLIDNLVTIRAGENSSTFVRLADGSYHPPQGSSEVLTVDGSGYHLRDRFGAAFEFDPEGKITSWQDANGNTMTFAYDGSGQLTTVTDALGKALVLGYSGGRLTTVTDPTGRRVEFAYDGERLSAVTDPGGGVWRYGYDAHNRLTEVFKADSTTVAVTTNVYDAFGRVQAQTDALGHTTTFYFSGYRNVEALPDGGEVVYFFDGGGLARPGFYVARQDQAGSRTTFAYDGRGLITSMADRLSGSASFTYHAASARLATSTNGKGQTTAYTYALRDGSTTAYNLARIDYADGANEQFTYDASGNLLTWRDAGGGTWTYTYNGRGQLLSVQNPSGGSVTYTYHASGALASSTDADIGTTSYTYDALQRLVRIDYPGGANEQFVYDDNDRLIEHTDRLGTVFAYAYDAGGNLTGLTRGQGLGVAQNESYGYDDMGQLITTTNPAGGQILFAYNALGSLGQITYPDGATVGLGYDSRRWLDRITDPAGNLWQATRDAESIIGAITTPEGRQVGLGSEATGYVAQLTDAAGSQVTAKRDEMDRVIEVVDRLNRKTTIERDGAGRVTGITTPVIGTVRYTRNALGLVTQITDPLGKQWDFAYTSMGRIAQITDPKGNSWDYAYDALGRTGTITYPDGVVETRSYDDAGHLTRRQFTDGLDLIYSYDPLGRLISTGSAPVALSYDSRDGITNTEMSGTDWGATYNARGLVQSVTYDGQMTVSYTYDMRGLLTQVSDDQTGSWIKLYYDDDTLLIKLQRSNGVDTEITRDENGRIARIKHGDKGEMSLEYDAEDQITKIIESLPLDVTSFIQPELVEYSYDDANQISSAGFGYDARGRRTQDPRRTYTWDAADRLTGIVEGTTTTALAYTALGEVSRRTVDGAATDYFYNYALRAHPIVAEKRGGSYHRFYVYTPDGRLLYSIDAPTTAPAARFYHFNHLGTTLFLTDDGGDIADTYGYTPFGYLATHSGSSDQPFTFVGQRGVRQEGDSGLYHMGARYYDSRTIQFLSRDPLWPDLEDPKALNPYQYAGQNPLSFIDPGGMAYFVDAQGNPLGVGDVQTILAMTDKPFVGQVGDDGGITWYGRGGYPLQNHLLPSTVDRLQGATSSATHRMWQAMFRPIEANQPPGPDNLGQRASSAKVGQMFGQGTETTGSQEDEDTDWDAYVMNESFDNGCCCSDCSLLDTGAVSRSPLGYLLGPVIGLLALGAIWLGLRRFVAARE